jgi:hypothetical protein
MISISVFKMAQTQTCLAEICQTFGQRQCNADMACPKSATHSLLNIVTSLIGPIWNGGNEMVQLGPSQHCNITHWTDMKEVE